MTKKRKRHTPEQSERDSAVAAHFAQARFLRHFRSMRS